MNAIETVIETADQSLQVEGKVQDEGVALRDLTTLELALVGGGMGLASFY